MLKDSMTEKCMYGANMQAVSHMNVIRDEIKDKALKEVGYVKMDGNVLSAEDIDTLLNWYLDSSLKKKSNTPHLHLIDSEDKKELSRFTDKIKDFIYPLLENIFYDPYFVFGTLVIKFPNEKDILHLHQDGSFLEDDRHGVSLTCWLPLVDVDIDNGCLGFIGKSHLIYNNNIRPAPYPAVYLPLKKHAYSLIPYMNMVPMKAGEMVVFNSKTFHGGFPNFTDKPRYALSIWITVKDKRLAFYYLKPGTKDSLLKYRVDTDFFTRYDNDLLQSMYERKELINGYEVIAEEKYVVDDFSVRKMVRLMRQLGNTYNRKLADFASARFPNEMKRHWTKFITDWF